MAERFLCARLCGHMAPAHGAPQSTRTTRTRQLVLPPCCLPGCLPCCCCLLLPCPPAPAPLPPHCRRAVTVVSAPHAAVRACLRARGMARAPPPPGTRTLTSTRGTGIVTPAADGHRALLRAPPPSPSPFPRPRRSAARAVSPVAVEPRAATEVRAAALRPWATRSCECAAPRAATRSLP